MAKGRRGPRNRRGRRRFRRRLSTTSALYFDHQSAVVIPDGAGESQKDITLQDLVPAAYQSRTYKPTKIAVTFMSKYNNNPVVTSINYPGTYTERSGRVNSALKTLSPMSKVTHVVRVRRSHDWHDLLTEDTVMSAFIKTYTGASSGGETFPFLVRVWLAVGRQFDNDPVVRRVPQSIVNAVKAVVSEMNRPTGATSLYAQVAPAPPPLRSETPAAPIASQNS